MTDFYYSWQRLQSYTKKISKLTESHKNKLWKVANTLTDSIPHTFVIVIGESTTPFHQSLYGYQRATTPRMDSLRDELIAFQNAYSPATSTAASLEKVLSFATRKNPEAYIDSPLITELFNAAGFTTYWITKQKLTTGWHFGITEIVAYAATHLVDVSKNPYDEVVLPALQTALNDTAQNKVIFVHLMGSHFEYEKRYPKEFAKFDHKNGDITRKAFQTDAMLSTIDQYDNTILYGDYIFAEIKNRLAATKCSSYLLYFSDHGEEIYDHRPIMGHASQMAVPVEQKRVPLILWHNNAYKAEFSNLTFDTETEFNTENLIDKIEEWSGIKWEQQKK